MLHGELGRDRIGRVARDPRALELAGVRCEIEVDPDRMRPTDVSVGDASRLRAATGWVPRTPWTDTLSRLLAATAA